MKTPSRRKRQRYPAEKPREHQWCRSFDPQPGVFVCGRCKLWFNKRISARQHRKKCNDKYRHEFERLANSLRDRRTPAQKRRETRDLLDIQVYRKQGRPPHPHHVCKHCSKELPSADKKATTSGDALRGRRSMKRQY